MSKNLTVCEASTTIQLRVRYVECDPMNVAHHSSYIAWLEMARTELLREQGVAYRELEEQGVFFVVARLGIKYRRPAKYDDLIDVHVKALPTAGVKIVHQYEVKRGGELLATAETTLACLDAKGRMRPVPEGLAGSR